MRSLRSEHYPPQASVSLPSQLSRLSSLPWPPRRKGLMQRSSSFKISPVLPPCVKGGCLCWDIPLMLSESRGYRITNLLFSKIVVSVSLNGVILTPLLPDKLISVTGCQGVHTQDRAPGRAHWQRIFWNPCSWLSPVFTPLNWTWDTVIDSDEAHAVVWTLLIPEINPWYKHLGGVWCILHTPLSLHKHIKTFLSFGHYGHLYGLASCLC